MPPIPITTINHNGDLYLYIYIYIYIYIMLCWLSSFACVWYYHSGILARTVRFDYYIGKIGQSGAILHSSTNNTSEKNGSDPSDVESLLLFRAHHCMVTRTSICERQECMHERLAIEFQNGRLIPMTNIILSCSIFLFFPFGRSS